MLAVLYTLYLARDLLIPLTVAWLVYLLLAPLVNRLSRIGVPCSLSAFLLLSALLAGLVGSISALQEPATEWLSEAPTNLRQLTQDFKEAKQPLEDIRKLGEEVAEITQLEEKASDAPKVEIQTPALLERAAESMPRFFGGLIVTLLTSFFLLASGDIFSRKILTFGKTWSAKRRLILILRRIQFDISRYLRTVTLINLTLGLTVGVVMWALDVPNPELWGAMVAVFNFAPYLGAIVSTVVLTVVGAATQETLVEALQVPGAFLLVTSMEGALFTPLVLGKRLSLNPLFVFVSVVAWGWLWGVIGALIAVPIISSVKIVLSHTKSGRPWAVLMESSHRLSMGTRPVE